MIFHAHEKDLDFELAGRRYVVPFGSEVEIPDRLAYCIARRGLLLKSGTCGGELVKPTAPSRPIMTLARRQEITAEEAAEELAGLTGEDPADDDDEVSVADDDDYDPAQRTAEQLARAGITLPGRRPKRK